MPILNLTSVERAPVRLREEVPVDHPVWAESGIVLNEPLRVDLEGMVVGEGVLVRGEIETEVAADCRRCLTPAPVRIRDRIGLLFEPLGEEDEEALDGELYPLPTQGDKLDLTDALREQLTLRIPDYVVCSETCRGLCPTCGAELNHASCDCVPEPETGSWDALKKIEFD